MNTSRTGAALTGAFLIGIALANAQTQEVGDPQKGLAFAKSTCGTCHAVEGGGSSPNPNAPSFAQLAALPGMSETALTVLLRSSHRTMPNLVIELDDQRNLSAYIMGLKAQR